MQDFPGNSQKATRPESRSQEPKKIERVTSAEADRRKRGLGRKFKETFVGGSARMAFEYMLVDVIVPAIQETMIDAFQGGVERLIRGESVRKRSGTPTGYPGVGPRVDYSGVSRSTAQRTATRTLSRQSRTRHNFDELVIQSRQEATEVIDQMFELLSRHGVVLVHDLYDLTGIEGSHIDYKWGWTQLRGAKVVPLRGRNGYLLDLPEPEQLD